jgi:hypothetical protein
MTSSLRALLTAAAFGLSLAGAAHAEGAGTSDRGATGAERPAGSQADRWCTNDRERATDRIAYDPECPAPQARMRGDGQWQPVGPGGSGTGMGTGGASTGGPGALGGAGDTSTSSGAAPGGSGDMHNDATTKGMTSGQGTSP